MAKIIEGIFCFKGNGDDIIALSQNLSFEEKELIKTSDISFANLYNFEEGKGYVDNVVNVSRNVYCYTFKKVNNRLFFAKHQNIDHDTKNRGKIEVIHFVHTDDEKIKSTSLMALDVFKKDISPIVLNDKAMSELPVIEKLPRFEEVSYSEFKDRKKQVIELLDYIIYAKKSQKTLYISYKLSEIDEFHRDFFLALNMLPVGVCNELSYVTCYGGGTSDKYDIVGVAIEPSLLDNMSYSSEGILYKYPQSDIVTIDEKITNNKLHSVLINIENEMDYINFSSFISKNYSGEKNLDSYIGFVEFYESLCSKNVLLQDKEFEYASTLNKTLSYLSTNLASVEQLDEDNLERTLFKINDQFVNYRKITNLTMLSSQFSKTIELLQNIYQNTKLERIKDEVITWLYIFLFEFDRDVSDSKFVASHANIIEEALANQVLSDPLFDYLNSDDRRYELFFDLSDRLFDQNEEGRKCEQVYYWELFNYLFGRFENDSHNIVRIIRIIKKLSDLININDLFDLIFHEQKNINRSFVILSTYISSIGNEEEAVSINQYVVEYINKKELLEMALEEIKVSSFAGPSRNRVLALKNLICDSFIKYQEIKTYDELCEFIDRSERFNDNQVVYNEIRDRVVSNHLNEDVIESINNVSKQTIIEDKYIHINKIREYFLRNHESIPKRIVALIEALIKETEEHETYLGRESELSEFRIQFVLRAVALLPENDSREIIYTYIGKEKAEPLIGESLGLNSEQYADAAVKVSEEFLRKTDNVGITGVITDKHQKFIKEIFVSQNKKRFNIHTVATIAESTGSLFLFGGGALLVSLGLSLLFYNFVTHKTYLTFYLVLSIVIAVLSGLIGLVNMQNKGRKKVYLISLLECLGLILIGIGLFTVLVVNFGGK